MILYIQIGAEQVLIYFEFIIKNNSFDFGGGQFKASLIGPDLKSMYSDFSDFNEVSMNVVV